MKLLKTLKKVGKTVAIIGAGGIGFDVAEFLLHKSEENKDSFYKRWGINKELTTPGGVKEKTFSKPERKVYLLQRKKGKLGKGLGKTTGWIHRQSLKMEKVNFIDQAEYNLIDDEGLHYTRESKDEILKVDSIIILCRTSSSKRIRNYFCKRKASLIIN